MSATLRDLVRAHRRRRARDRDVHVYAWIQTSGRAAHQRARVLLQLVREPGLTRNELAARLQLPISTICARVDELVDDGAVHVGPRRASTISGIVNETLYPRRVRVGLPPPPNARARQTLLEGWIAA